MDLLTESDIEFSNTEVTVTLGIIGEEDLALESHAIYISRYFRYYRGRRLGTGITRHIY